MNWLAKEDWKLGFVKKRFCHGNIDCGLIFVEYLKNPQKYEHYLGLA